MPNSMTASQYADYMEVVKKAVAYRVRNPQLTLRMLEKKFGVSRSSISKYSVDWHPELFCRIPRTVKRKAVIDAVKERSRRRVRRLMAATADGWVRLEDIAASVDVIRFEVREV